MKTFNFALRNTREIIRDPLNLAFGLGFPLVLLLLLSAIQASIPVSLFEIDRLTPGITVFGLSFITLFSATLVSRDRQTSLLCRLYTTPMRPLDFILGYTLPLLPMGLAQSLICYIVAFPLGLRPTTGILMALLCNIPTTVLYIALGLAFGSVLTDKQVGGICGALLTNLSAWLSGIWFDISLVGGVFEVVAEILPFKHSVDLTVAALEGNGGEMLLHLPWVLGYAAVLLALSVAVFLRQMKRE